MPKEEVPEGPPAAEGTVLAEQIVDDGAVDGDGASAEVPVTEGKDDAKEEAVTKVSAKKEETDGVEELTSSSIPSNTLHIHNVPEDCETSELEVRLMRFGQVLSIEKVDNVAVAKFSKTNEAYAAREKLNGSMLYDSTLQVNFGPQEADHYNRLKKNAQGRGRKEFLDSGEGMVAEVATSRGTGKKRDNAGHNKSSGLRAWNEDAVKKDDKEEPESKVAREEKKVDPCGSLQPPSQPVSRWSEALSFEQQLEDFMKMHRHGMYNRYLVLGKLPLELRTGEAIWRMVAPVQRDILQIEMLTCFGKPVAHVALRSATAAAAMHRLTQQLHPKLTVAFAPPRRATPTLWLGNVDDFVPRKDLETLLERYGKVVNGLRYLPARTCAFATFSEVTDAIKARNNLYGLEILKNQYLNCDFVDEAANENLDQIGQMWGGMAPWAAWGQAPPARGPWEAAQQPWGAWAPANYPRGRDGGRADGAMRGWASPRRAARDGKRTRRRSRSPRRAGSTERAARRQDPAAIDRDRSSASEPAEKPKVAKAKVRLYKMGEFCCNIVANFVKGKENPEPLVAKLHIDQRTKIDHCRQHMERADSFVSIWHFSAADRKECAAYDALCDYFVEKQRVGLVQTPSYYVYVVPPTEMYLKELKLPSSNFVVGVQIPIKK